MRKNRRVTIDFGTLNDIAELSVNGKKVGVLWYPPYKADITDFVHRGKNIITIAVTNNWANRMIGDEQWEPDFEVGYRCCPSGFFFILSARRKTARRSPFGTISTKTLPYSRQD